MPRVERDRELARRRQRKKKLRKLRARFRATNNPAEKREIQAKARRVSPFVNFEAEEQAAEQG